MLGPHADPDETGRQGGQERQLVEQAHDQRHRDTGPGKRRGQVMVVHEDLEALHDSRWKGAAAAHAVRAALSGSDPGGDAASAG